MPRRRPGVVTRRRLLDRLHAHLDRRLFLVVAPAGYGKTTLAVDFASEVGWRCAWYSIDAADADPRVFLSYVVGTIERVLPGAGTRAQAMLEMAPGRSVDVPSVVAEIVAGIQATADDPFLLVLDDISAVSGEPEIMRAVDLLIANLPDACRLILLSRHTLKLRLIGQVAQRNVLGLGKNDLRFTEDEVAETLERQGLDVSAAGELTNVTDGWITGVLLSAPAAGQFGSVSGTRRPAHHFLASEVILRIPESTREFAQHAALFNAFSPRDYEETFDQTGAAEHIGVLEEVSPFIERLEGEGHWYRFTQLFRSALLELFEASNPNGFRAAALRVADWAKARRDWDTQLRLVGTALGREAVAQILAELAPKQFEAGNLQRVRAWLDDLPEELLDAYPALAVLRARIALYLDGRPEAQVRAERALRLGGLDPESEIRAQLVRANALWLTGFPQEALGVTQQALPVAEQLGLPTLRAEVQRHQGVILLQMGRLREALGLLLQARDHLPQDDFAIAQVDEGLGIIWAKFGEIGAARRSFHLALKVWERLGNRTQICNTLNSLSIRAQELGNFAEAHEYITQALQHAEESNNRRMIAWICETYGDLLFAEGRLADAERLFKRALKEGRALDERSVVCSSLEGLGQVAISRQDHETAAHYLRTGEALALDSPQLEAGQLIDIALTRLDILLGHWSEAYQRVAGVVQQVEVQGKAVLLARARFWLAAAYAGFGRTDEARDVWWQSDPRIRIAAECLLDPKQRDELQQILTPVVGERLWSAGPISAPATSRPIEPRRRTLEVRTLGPIEVRLDGRPILLTRSRMLEHLVFLAVHPQGARADAMVESLWSDAQFGREFASLQQTIYRLRRELGQEAVLYQRGQYRLGATFEVVVDAEQLESEINAVLERSVEDSSLPAHGQRAERLYRGPYLEAFDGPWCNTRRDRLAASYLAAMTKVAEHHLFAGRSAEAVGLLSRLTEVDPLNEPLFAMLVSALYKSGDAAAAKHFGRRFVETCQRELGEPPSPGFLRLLSHLS